VGDCPRPCETNLFNNRNEVRFTGREKMRQHVVTMFKVFVFGSDARTKTISPLINGFVNDVLLDVRKCDVATGHLLRTWPTFSGSVMVSAAVSKLGYTSCLVHSWTWVLFATQPNPT